VACSKWTVLIGRAGFNTIPSLPDPTLSLLTLVQGGPAQQQTDPPPRIRPHGSAPTDPPLPPQQPPQPHSHDSQHNFQHNLQEKKAAMMLEQAKQLAAAAAAAGGGDFPMLGMKRSYEQMHQQSQQAWG